MKSWQSLGAIASKKCLPFTKGRNGTALGEGAATLILERRSSVAARGGKVLGTVLGGACTSDGQHFTKPSREGIARTIQEAMENAKVDVNTPLMISTHGTGTILNDECEAKALLDIFKGNLSNKLAIASKGAHGHLLGATGAMEFLLGLLSIRSGWIPPAQGSKSESFPFCLPLVLKDSKVATNTVLLSNTFAFGGSNVVLLGNVECSEKRKYSIPKPN